MLSVCQEYKTSSSVNISYYYCCHYYINVVMAFGSLSVEHSRGKLYNKNYIHSDDICFRSVIAILGFSLPRAGTI